MTTRRVLRRACATGRLVVQRCEACGALAVPPKAVCPSCEGRSWSRATLGGDGEIASYTVIRVPPARLAAEAPYVVAVARMAEGVSLLGRLDGVPVDARARRHARPLRRAVRERRPARHRVPPPLDVVRRLPRPRPCPPARPGPREPDRRPAPGLHKWRGALASHADAAAWRSKGGHACTTPRIVAIGTAVPARRFTQEELADLFGYRDGLRRRFFLNSGIDGRHLYMHPAEPRPETDRRDVGPLRRGQRAPGRRGRRGLPRARPDSGRPTSTSW